MSKIVSTRKVRARSVKKDVQRYKILLAAQDIFSMKGYYGSSMNDIAKASNINKCTLYTFFVGKSTLWYYSSMQYMDSLFQLVNPVATSNEPPEKKLRKMLELHIKWRCKNIGMAVVNKSERKEMPAKLLRSYIKYRDEYESLYRNVVDQIISKYQTKYINAKYATLFILGVANSINEWYDPTGELSPNQLAKLTYLVCSRILEFSENNTEGHD